LNATERWDILAGRIRCTIGGYEANRLYISHSAFLQRLNGHPYYYLRFSNLRHQFVLDGVVASNDIGHIHHRTNGAND